MKWLLRNTAFYALALFLLPFMLGGVEINGGLATLLLGGFLLTVMLLVIKPVINIISLPLNLVTMGLFSALTNVIILYLLTVLVPDISIQAFTFEGVNYAGFILPKVSFNTFFAYVVAAICISFIIASVSWITDQ